MRLEMGRSQKNERLNIYAAKLGILPRRCGLTKREGESLKKISILLAGLAGSAFKSKDKEIQRLADRALDALKEVREACRRRG